MTKIVFNTLTEMKKYCGPEENLSGGGEFIAMHGWGHELFNFKEDNGHCYGYATPWGKLNLRRISEAINSDKLGKYGDCSIKVDNHPALAFHWQGRLSSSQRSRCSRSSVRRRGERRNSRYMSNAIRFST